ncbi:MAG TPA: non-ribosomal peptide synthetase, partial [Spirillospora sp.]|nr:non-ribosomal peptide synthetase [Spirillospora sp.]
SAMLAQLENLNRVRERANTSPEGDYSFAAQMQRHGVTHLQCTPSLAAMLLENPANRAALGRLRQMLVGGEAFPASLANTLREIVPGDIFNMYGPTETTIWSAVHKLDGAGDSVPLGRPIANTVIYVLDSQLQPVPVGVPGELFIGGRGVVRGYHNRPELTAERFIKDPFGKAADTRLYRTGDMGRYLPDGTLEFLGRLDHQVKIRGHRIELGEIEALLDAHPTIEQSVVVAREDHNGDRRLIAYVIAAASAEVYAADVRAYLKAHLPEPMIPAQVVALDAFPLTPNNKIDRKALPAPEALAQEQSASYVPPQGDTEGRIATIWSEMLGLSQVGTEDNFFDLGGHSLLAVRMHRQICDTFSTQIPITDIFRFPTIKSLAAHLGKNHAASEAERGRSRAASRLEARQRRQERRQPRH